MARDVVCNMDVDEQQAKDDSLTSQYQGQTFFFCSSDCKEQFDDQPQRYARAQGKEPPQQRGRYTT